MALVEALGLLAVIAVLLYLYITRNHRYWEKRGIPFEKPLPFVGNLYEALTLTKNPGQIHWDIYNKHQGEKVVGVFNFLKPTLLVRDPSLVAQILTTDFHKFANNDFEIDEKVDPCLAKNIFIQRGEQWKRSRQALSPAFTIGKIKTTYGKIQDVADKLVQYLEKHPEPEVKNTMSLYSSEIVASWGIGIDGHSFDTPDPILPKLGKLMFDPSAGPGIVFTLFTFFPYLAKLLRISFVPKDVPAFFDGVLRNLISERSQSNALRKDFLQYFMDLKKKRSISRNDDQDAISDDDIVAGIISFFIEGYETSSIISAFLLQYLAQDPELQKRLRDDVDELYEKTSGQPGLDDVLELPLLDRIYSETLRLSGVLNMTKVCTQDCVLDLGDGKTLKVDKGTSTVISVAGLHSDPKYWTNPEKFDPDRFIDNTSRVKGSYVPFGEGPRMCIGIRVAHATIKTAIVKIIRNFEVLTTKKTAVKFVQEPAHFMAYQKGGFHMRFAKRSQPL